ncbi:MAG: hypothetical protein J0L75_09790 [Spirochaetes bacterium]|nr:hypothetical protein [Spirochaetota bacterium]
MKPALSASPKPRTSPAPDAVALAADLLGLGDGSQPALSTWLGAYAIADPFADSAFAFDESIPEALRLKMRTLCELFRTWQDTLRAQDPPVLSSPARVFEAVASLAVSPVEVLRVLHVDSRQVLLHAHDAAIGGPNRTRCRPVEILAPLLKRDGSRFILVHNHPSGDPQPSEDDLHFTRRLEQGCRLLGIEFIDHVVVARASWFSFRREGLL